MATRKIQNNFSGGVISPSLYGRSDLSVYYKACAKAENFIVTKEGSLRKRNGIVRLGSVSWYNTDNVRLFPYLFDRTKSGCLILKRSSGGAVGGQLYNKDGASVGGALTIGSNVSLEGFNTIQCKQTGDQLWVTGGGVFKVITVSDFDTSPSVSEKSWEQEQVPEGVASFECIGYKPDGTKYPTSEKSYAEYHYCAFVVKNGVASRRIVKNAFQARAWAAGAYVSCTVSVGESREFDYVVIGKSTGGNTNFGELARYYPEDFTAANDNTITYEDKNTSPGTAIYEQTDIMNGGIKNALCVDCFQQRRVFANASVGVGFTRTEIVSGLDAERYTPPGGIKKLISVLYVEGDEDVTSQCNIQNGMVVFPIIGTNRSYKVTYYPAEMLPSPMTLWFSEVGNLDNFYANRPSSDADAFSPTIASIGPAFIRWTVSYQEMLVLFTDCGIFSVGFSQSQGFSASSCRITRCSTLAVSPTIAPIQCDAGIVFVAADNKTVYTLSFDLQENMLKPTNRLVLAEHLTRKTSIKAMAVQSSPDNLVWFVLSDGSLAIFTFERTEEVFAWSTAKLGHGKVLDVISLGSYTDRDSGESHGDLVFLVEVVGTRYLATLSDGYADSITTLTYSVKAELVTLKAESQDRTIAGRKKNVKDVLIRLHETGNLSVKPTSGTSLTALSAPLGGSILFTGDVKVMPRGYINDAGQMTFVSDDDKPCEILQIVNDVEIFD